MTNQLGDLISRGEGGYNSYNRGTLHGHIVPASEACDFSNVTIGELLRRQSLPPGDPEKIFAVGKYQIIPTTMLDAVQKMRIEPEERYTPQLQERIFADYLIKIKRPPIYAYIVGKAGSTLYAAQKAAAQEWASIDDPDTPGKPFGSYAKHGNRSTTRSDQVAAALDSMREAYGAAINRGFASGEAWRLVSGQISGRDHTKNVLDDARATPARKDTSEQREIQTLLQRMGYKGENGRLLKVDGDLGPNSRHAIRSFQCAHHLHVDGVIGKETSAALEDARRWPLLSEETHPQHRLYEQVEHGLRQLSNNPLRGSQDLANTAVALTIAAHVNGMDRVDHVVPGSNGVNLFAVQGRLDDPAHRRVHVELAHALAHVDRPFEMPARRLAPTQSTLHAPHLAPSAQQATGAPAMAGP
jgi:hypothetical protein